MPSIIFAVVCFFSLYSVPSTIRIFQRWHSSSKLQANTSSAFTSNSFETVWMAVRLDVTVCIEVSAERPPYFRKSTYRAFKANKRLFLRVKRNLFFWEGDFVLSMYCTSPKSHIVLPWRTLTFSKIRHSEHPKTCKIRHSKYTKTCKIRHSEYPKTCKIRYSEFFSSKLEAKVFICWHRIKSSIFIRW